MTADPEVAVRAASVDDASVLARLRWRWRVDERGEVAPSAEDFAAAFAEWFDAHAETHLPFLAVRGTEPVGMAWLAVVTRVPGPQIWQRLSGFLQSVYVVPEHRDSGIGARLVTAAIDAARSRGLDYIIVHPSERSFPVYRRAGFAESAGLLELRLD
jgi:GNAT superfamily N-acetyltransferase